MDMKWRQQAIFEFFSLIIFKKKSVIQWHNFIQIYGWWKSLKPRQISVLIIINKSLI